MTYTQNDVDLIRQFLESNAGLREHMDRRHTILVWASLTNVFTLGLLLLQLWGAHGLRQRVSALESATAIQQGSKR